MFFNWTRPNHVPYPSVWLKFNAKDVYTDDSVEYTVQDLPENRFDEAINIMANSFLADAPLAKLRAATNDEDYVQDIVCIWKDIVKQRMTNVCFKSGSDEIIGLNFNYVSSQDDDSGLGENVFRTEINLKLNSLT